MSKKFYANLNSFNVRFLSFEYKKFIYIKKRLKKIKSR